MKKLILFFFIIIASSLGAYTPGDQYLVDYNQVLDDGNLAKQTVYFATQAELETWILERHEDPEVKHIWAAKIERPLKYEVVNEGDGGEVILDPLPVANPYRVTYQVKDTNGTWQFDCFYGTLEEAQARLDLVSKDPDKRLFQSTPPLLLSAQLKHIIKPGEGATRVIITDE